MNNKEITRIRLRPRVILTFVSLLTAGFLCWAHQADASACDQAKESLLTAEDDEEMDRAITRIRILCED